MTAAEILSFRRKIGDKTKAAEDIVNVTNNDSYFGLRFSNITRCFVYVNDELIPEADYLLEPSAGTITFGAALQPDDVLRVDYEYAAYTDGEIEELVETYGFDTAIVEVLSELLMDSARMYDYSEGATTAKLSQVYDHIKGMIEMYTARAAAAADGYTAADGTKMGGVSLGRRTSSYDSSRRKPRDDKQDLSRLIV